MPGPQVKFTFQDLLTAPDDGNRYEIFEGELIVTPSPALKHQNAVFNLTLLLGQYIKTHKLGTMLSAPIDVYFDAETVFKPDLLFVSDERSHILEEQRINGAPDLIIEILSPATEDQDRGFKFRHYEKEGVREYWLADPNKEILEIYMLKQKGYELHGRFSNNDEVSAPTFSSLSFHLEELWK